MSFVRMIYVLNFYGFQVCKLYFLHIAITKITKHIHMLYSFPSSDRIISAEQSNPMVTFLPFAVLNAVTNRDVEKKTTCFVLSC
jgi:hypothetical protein